MRISDWSSDVCSSDLKLSCRFWTDRQETKPKPQAALSAWEICRRDYAEPLSGATKWHQSTKSSLSATWAAIQRSATVRMAPRFAQSPLPHRQAGKTRRPEKSERKTNGRSEEHKSELQS